MTTPTFDPYGYPTEETLQAITDWPAADGEALLAFVREAWRYPEYWTVDADGTHRVSTGGWSGNESLVGAMEANAMFWSLWWQSSRRGGHYEFRSMLARKP